MQYNFRSDGPNCRAAKPEGEAASARRGAA
jgi:hypothetical protein